MIARNTRIALTIIDKLCRRLQNANLKIQHLVKKDAEGLIALHLSTVFQELPAGQSSVPFQKCLEDVSLSLELPMEDVRKTLENLRGEGILGLDGETLRLVDPEKLHRITESVGKEPASSA
jgi:CRP-like cAMP-binding protein